MISYLNEKYGAGAKVFLQILDVFKENPFKILHDPNLQVKRLISDTLDKFNREQSQPFRFRN